jgi:catechol 2,3-dioxygenase-like lactoylglutathione lyase family enzyme
MRARFGVLTLGVDDIERSLKFYRDGLGLESDGIIGQEFEHGATALVRLEGGMVLSLFPRSDLGLDAGIEATPPSPTEFSIGHNVSSEAEVDQVMALAEKAGARVAVRPHKTFWGGYAGYFQDPDGHLWEVLHNPAFLPDGL